MRPPQVREAPDPAVAASRHPDAATSRRRGLGPAPDPVGAVERDELLLSVMSRVRIIQLVALNVLTELRFSTTKVSDHLTEAGFSRYIYAKRLQLITNDEVPCSLVTRPLDLATEHIEIRISDHRSFELRSSTFSVVVQRAGRIWELPVWIERCNLKRTRISHMQYHNVSEGRSCQAARPTTHCAHRRISVTKSRPPSVIRGAN